MLAKHPPPLRAWRSNRGSAALRFHFAILGSQGVDLLETRGEGRRLRPAPEWASKPRGSSLAAIAGPDRGPHRIERIDIWGLPSRFSVLVRQRWSSVRLNPHGINCVLSN